MPKVKKGENCLNCNAHIGDDNFCSECGQINDTRHLTFGQLISESLANVLSFDGRFFKTFLTVISKPGRVARDFTDGKRVRYMNPVRFYFLSSLLIIFAIQYQNNHPKVITEGASSEERGIINFKLDSVEEKNSDLAALLSESQNEIAEATSFQKINFMLSYLNFKPNANVDEVLQALSLEKGFFNEFLFSQAQKLYAFNNDKEDNYDSFNRAFLNKLFWILFFYIPILGLLLKLIYLRRKINYPEHLFFAFYQQAFFFQLLFIYVIFNLSAFFFSLVLLIYGIHLLLALKNFYGQKWSKTIFKFFLTNFLSIISFMLFFVLSAMIVFLTL
tara:strand:- start:2547 stop:3539 length:993 start_codon:yes stop_codon:yes gene_type:complete